MGDTTAKNLAEPALPADDGAIEQALTELDVKLDRWAEALTEAGMMLADRATQLAHPADPPPDVAPEDQASIPSDAPDHAEPDVATPEPEPEPVLEPTDAQKDATASPAEPRPTSQHKGIVSYVDAVEPSPDQPAPARAPQAAGPDEDDEELLASLDPEVASAIRIRRRMSPVPKTVRELLAEYEDGQSTSGGSSSKVKKTWWSKG